MSKPGLLALVARYPHPVALARRVRASALHEGLRRLERAGLVTRRSGVHRITGRGESELVLEHELRTAIARALSAQTGQRDSFA